MKKILFLLLLISAGAASFGQGSITVDYIRSKNDPNRYPIFAPIPKSSVDMLALNSQIDSLKVLLSTANVVKTYGTPTVTLGAGAGTGATYTLTGDDVVGYVVITTGSAPQASSVVATITFSSPLLSVPKLVQINAVGSNAATAMSRVFSSSTAWTTGSFTINTNATALAANTTYGFGYNVKGAGGGQP